MAEQEPVHHYKIRIRRPRLTPEAQNSTDTMAQQGRGEVHSDVLGSYTGLSLIHILPRGAKALRNASL